MHLATTIRDMGGFEIHEMAGNALGYLEGADVVVLQNMNEEFGAEHAFVQTLRQYVAGGGGLLLGHDTAWFMASPVPEVARRGVPKNNVEAGRHVVNTDLVTGAAGTFGKGRIVFSGCYYGYARPLEGVEQQVLEGALRWLVGVPAQSQDHTATSDSTNSSPSAIPATTISSSR